MAILFYGQQKSRTWNIRFIYQCQKSSCQVFWVVHGSSDPLASSIHPVSAPVFTGITATRPTKQNKGLQKNQSEQYPSNSQQASIVTLIKAPGSS